jgi:hypothetical protein
MLKILLAVIFLPVFCNANDKDLECIPDYRIEIDTLTTVSYPGTLQKPAPLGKEACLGPDGLMSGKRYVIDADLYMRYLPLDYVVDSKEDYSKLSKLVFPFDLFVVEERTVGKGNSGSMSHAIYVVAREKGSQQAGELLWTYDYEKGSEILVIADKAKRKLKGSGLNAGVTPYGGQMTTSYELTDADMKELSKAKTIRLVLPFAPKGTRRSELPKPFTITVELSKAGNVNLQKFIKVARVQVKP